MRLFSYVVEHDNGFSPNPYYNVCTLVHCKYRKDETKRLNLVEMAEVGDWVIGTGGADLKKSAGHGKLVYAMRVEKKLTLGQYYEDHRFECKKKKGKGTYQQRMGDNFYDGNWQKINRYVLIGRQFYYFGRNAIDIPPEFRNHNIEKKGPGYRSDFSEKFIEKFVNWIECNYNTGMHGDPCGREADSCNEVSKNPCK